MKHKDGNLHKSSTSILSAKGRRKLEFVKKEKQPPLSGKLIYLDIKDARQTRNIEGKLKQLGGIVEKFLIKDVNYVISSNAPLPGQKKSGKSGPGTAESPACQSTPSPFNLGQSPSPSAVEAKKETVTRGKAILQIAKNKGSHTNVVDTAEKMGIKIVSLDAAVKWIDKEMLKVKPVISASTKPETSTSCKQPAKKRGTKVLKLKTPYVKYEADNCQYRPIMQQLEKWPHANVDTAAGTCPFDGRALGRPQNSERGDREEVVGAGNIMSPATPHAQRDELSGTPQAKSQSKTTKADDQSKLFGVPIMTAGDLKREKEKRKREAKRKGYCECCKEKYEDIDKHLRGEQHKNFVRNKKNFDSLDKLIRRGPTTVNFLQCILFQHCMKRTAGKPLSQMPSDEEVELVKEKKNDSLTDSGEKSNNLKEPRRERKCNKSEVKVLVEKLVFREHYESSGTISSRLRDTYEHDYSSPRKLDVSDRGNGASLPRAVVKRSGCRSGVYGSPRRSQSRPVTSEKTLVIRDSPIASLQPLKDFLRKHSTKKETETESDNKQEHKDQKRKDLDTKNASVSSSSSVTAKSTKPETSLKAGRKNKAVEGKVDYTSTEDSQISDKDSKTEKQPSCKGETKSRSREADLSENSAFELLDFSSSRLRSKKSYKDLHICESILNSDKFVQMKALKSARELVSDVSVATSDQGVNSSDKLATNLEENASGAGEVVQDEVKPTRKGKRKDSLVKAELEKAGTVSGKAHANADEALVGVKSSSPRKHRGRGNSDVERDNDDKKSCSAVSRSPHRQTSTPVKRSTRNQSPTKRADTNNHLHISRSSPQIIVCDISKRKRSPRKAVSESSSRSVSPRKRSSKDDKDVDCTSDSHLTRSRSPRKQVNNESKSDANCQLGSHFTRARSPKKSTHEEIKRDVSVVSDSHFTRSRSPGKITHEEIWNDVNVKSDSHFTRSKSPRKVQVEDCVDELSTNLEIKDSRCNTQSPVDRREPLRENGSKGINGIDVESKVTRKKQKGSKTAETGKLELEEPVCSDGLASSQKENSVPSPDTMSASPTYKVRRKVVSVSPARVHVRERFKSPVFSRKSKRVSAHQSDYGSENIQQTPRSRKGVEEGVGVDTPQSGYSSSPRRSSRCRKRLRSEFVDDQQDQLEDVPKKSRSFNFCSPIKPSLVDHEGLSPVQSPSRITRRKLDHHVSDGKTDERLRSSKVSCLKDVDSSEWSPRKSPRGRQKAFKELDSIQRQSGQSLKTLNNSPQKEVENISEPHLKSNPGGRSARSSPSSKHKKYFRKSGSKIKSGKTIKLNRSWTLLSERSMSKLLESEPDMEPFQGFSQDVDQSLPSDLSYEEVSEVTMSEDSHREWIIEEPEPEDELDQTDDTDDVIQTSWVSNFNPSPEKNSNSSWGDACDSFLKMSCEKRLQISSTPQGLFHRSCSPRKRNRSPYCSPLKRELETVFEESPGSRRTPKKPRKFSPRVFCQDDEVEVGEGIVFNFNYQTSKRESSKRERSLQSSPEISTGCSVSSNSSGRKLLKKASNIKKTFKLSYSPKPAKALRRIPKSNLDVPEDRLIIVSPRKRAR